MHKITRPTLIINEAIARNNIRKMANKALQNNMVFEPHFKTHQSKEVGEWFRDEGVEAITVSSVSMAQYFSVVGWEKITIAFPVNMLEISGLNDVATRSSLTLLVQDVETIHRLNDLEEEVQLYIEIDPGYHRSGVESEGIEEIENLISAIENSEHSFKGFYCHAGNSYSGRGSKEVIKIYKNLEIQMASLKKKFDKHRPQIAIGDTPTCSVVNSFNGIDSIHPGNFVFYDYTQVLIGSCNLDQIATYLLCPVVAKSETRNEVIIYGGGVHLSKESIETEEGNVFGIVGYLNEGGKFNSYPNSYIKSISQEHGIISTTAEVLLHIQVGDLVAIIPVHSCMTVDCMGQIYTDKDIPISKMIL